MRRPLRLTRLTYDVIDLNLNYDGLISPHIELTYWMIHKIWCMRDSVVYDARNKMYLIYLKEPTNVCQGILPAE